MGKATDSSSSYRPAPRFGASRTGQGAFSTMLSPKDWRELRQRAIDQGRSASSIIRNLVQMTMWALWTSTTKQ